MRAQPAPGSEFFTAPSQPNQRRYEALRAYFVERISVADAGARVGYTRASMASLLRDFRAGKIQMFAPPAKPGPKSAPAKDRARARVLALRREGLSVYEISSRLRAEATPLNHTGVGQILAEEGFGRLLRGPAPSLSRCLCKSVRVNFVCWVVSSASDRLPPLVGVNVVRPRCAAGAAR